MYSQARTELGTAQSQLLLLFLFFSIADHIADLITCKMLFTVLNSRVSETFLNSRLKLAVFLGRISMAVYLLHCPVMLCCEYYLQMNAAEWSTMLLIAGITFSLSVISTFAFEEPLQRILRK